MNTSRLSSRIIEDSSEIEFELKNFKSYSVVCPSCSHRRGKSEQRCLSVFIDGDGTVKAQCYHQDASCHYYQRRYFALPDGFEGVKEVTRVEESQFTPPPRGLALPATYKGGTVYWYKDLDGNPLYGIVRYNLEDGRKTFNPLIYDHVAGEFVSGAGIGYPSVKALYNAQYIKQADKILIVEGEKAADAGQAILGKLGYAVVSWRGGAGSVAQQPWDMLRHSKEVLIWPDNDLPGMEAATKLLEILPVKQVKILKVSHLPAKADIADDITKDQIAEAFAGGTTHTTAYKGPLTVEELFDRISNRPPTIKTGFDVLDTNLPLPPSGLISVVGRTGHGKTLLAIALAVKWLQAGRRVMFMSYEEPAERLVHRFVKVLAPDVEYGMYTNAKEFDFFKEKIYSGALEIYDQSCQISADQLLRSFDHVSYKGALLIVDNLQILPFKSAGASTARYLTLKEQFIDPIRIVSNNQGFLTLVLGQLTPNEMNPEADTPREGKDLYMSSEVVLRVWNKEDFVEHPFLNLVKGNYAIHVVKNRSGTSNLVFDCKAEGGAKLDITAILSPEMLKKAQRKAREATKKTDYDEVM